MKDMIPSNVAWTKEKVARVNVEKNEIECENGEKITYNHVIFASGMRLNWEKVKGLH